jgi:inhibitor of KinA sporulation pathway (predicted exonuclease)
MERNSTKQSSGHIRLSFHALCSYEYRHENSARIYRFHRAGSVCLADWFGTKLKAAQEQIDQTPAFANKAHVAFTEWLFIGHRPGTPSFTNMGGAIDTAGFFNMLMRNSSFVPISDMTGTMEFAGIWKSAARYMPLQGITYSSYIRPRMHRALSASRRSLAAIQYGMALDVCPIFPMCRISML